MKSAFHSQLADRHSDEMVFHKQPEFKHGFDRLASHGPFGCIIADPPWPVKGTGKWCRRGKNKNGAWHTAPYSTMSVDAIAAMPIGDLAAEDCHLWLWTDNKDLHAGFHVLEAWGFRYLAPVHWIKPSGFGCWWIHRTQTILFAYRRKCRFPKARFRPNLIVPGRNPERHSAKPEESYALAEEVSPGPRLELFARRRRPGWIAWGNEVPAPAAGGERDRP